MIEVVLTDEFVAWFDGLDRSEKNAVTHLVELLERSGVKLGFPYSSAIKGSKYVIRELRKKGQALRLIYAFGPRRQAVMIIGGDKTGDDRFYEVIVPLAEKLWEQNLSEQAAGSHDDEDEG